MRKISVIAALAVLFVLSSCATKNDMDSLQSQIDELKNSEISSILSGLADVDNALKGLAEADKALEGGLEVLENSLKKLDDLSEKLSSVESVSLENYETINESISSIESSIKAIGENIETLTSDFEAAVGAARSDFEAALGKLQERLLALSARVTACELDIDSIKKDLASRIQSLTYVPQYTDGKSIWEVKNFGNGAVEPSASCTFYYDVQPSSLTSALAASASSLKWTCAFTQTRADAPSLSEVQVSSAAVVNGLLAVTVSASSVDQEVFYGKKNVNFCLSVDSGNRKIRSSFTELDVVSVKYVAFDNADFKSFCVSKYDSDQDGEVSVTEASTVTSMNAANTTFSSVGGIEMFVNLTSVNFSSNKNLENLDLSRNKPMTSINLTGCTALAKFDYDDSVIDHITCDFAIGRTLTVNGTWASVCYVSNNGVRRVIGLDYSNFMRWTESNLHFYGATSMTDGIANTNKIVAYGDYDCPPVKWCRSKGAKWYLPALNELTNLPGAVFTSKEFCSNYVWSSTEDSEETAYISHGSANMPFDKLKTWKVYAMKVL